MFRIAKLLTILTVASMTAAIGTPLHAGFHLTDWTHDDDDGVLVSDILHWLGWGAVTGAETASAGVANVVEPIDAKPRWDPIVIPWYEISFVENWTFESRSGQPLAVGNSDANSKRLDWSGAPGFTTRLAFQPFEAIGLEAILDYTSTDESQRYGDTSGFATKPPILFANQILEAQRQATIASGQLNVMFRDEPFNFMFMGLRWWHQDDSLALRARTSGQSWFNETQTNTPLLQIGINRTLVGKRSIWVNRASGGMGAAYAVSRTRTSQVPGVSAATDTDEVRFAGFMELKTELGYSITHRLAARLGAQMLMLSDVYRSAAQINSTDLATGLSSPNSDALLLSSLYTGLSYKY